VVLLALAPQDLLERERTLKRSLCPPIDYSDVKPRRSQVELGVQPDFACGTFDLRTSFRSLFDKNLREEFLGGALRAVQAELAGSALVLACYASPTVCDAIKHYRLSANSMLGMELDSCRTVEQSLDGVRQRSQARAIKECLDRKAREGAPLDEARKACARSQELPGLDGRPSREIDLLRELGLSDTLVPSLRIGAGTVRAEVRETAVLEAYEAKRRRRLEAWQAAVRDPEGAALEVLGPVTRAELAEVAAQEPARREAVMRSVAAALALSDVVRESHEAERALEAAELRAAPEVREELARRRAALRNEVSRLSEAFEMERRVNAAVAQAGAAAAAEGAARARENLAPRRAGEVRDRAVERTKPWGCEVRKEGGRP
jgi:hypothetical protein